MKLASDKPSTEGSIEISQIYPTAEGTGWSPIKDGTGRYLVKSLDLTVSGTCSASVKKILITSGTYVLPETATCLADGTFTWTKIFNSSEQGDMNLKVIANGENDVRLSTQQEISLRVDVAPPPSPVISSPIANPYTHVGSSSTVTLSGTVGLDTVKLTGPGGIDIPLTRNQWTYDVDLTGGGSLDFSFTASDAAGNASPATVFTGSWSSDAVLRLATASPGAKATDAGTGYKLEASLGPQTGFALDAGTSFRLETGFNQLTNQLRTP